MANRTDSAESAKSLLFRVPKTTVYRGASGKCIAIELNTGRIYYFSAETECFFRYFAKTRKLSDYCERAGVEGQDRAYVHSFCDFLLKKGLLEKSGDDFETSEAVEEALVYQKPVFLSESDKTIEQISFACP